MVMLGWDWVVLLPAVLLAVFAVMGWSLHELSEMFIFFRLDQRVYTSQELHKNVGYPTILPWTSLATLCVDPNWSIVWTYQSWA